MRKTRDDYIEKQPTKTEGLKDLTEFLSLINSTINDIRKSDQKKYSLLSSIFNCFYENKTISLPRKAIYEYIHQDILKYKNKMLISFVENGTNSMDIISEENFLKKTHSIISRNKCLIEHFDNQNVDKISLDINFIMTHKNLLLKNVFGKEVIIANMLPSLKLKNPRKIKNSSNPMKEQYLNNSQEIIKDDTDINEDDFEIEIIDSDQEQEQEQEETDMTEPKKEKKNNVNEVKDFYNTNSNSKIININNINNISGSSSKTEEIQYLNKKRKSHRNHTRKGLRSNKKNNSINSSEEKYDSYIRELLDDEEEDDKQKKGEKGETIAEKEILSLIEEGKIYLSLFNDNDLLKEIQSKKNNSNNPEENDDIFIKNLLLNYQDGDTLKSYLNMINDDYGEFQNSIKSLINYKNSLNNNSSGDKFMTKFSIMNKIILGKEKCSILIDKIVVKLKQLILEYNFIKKVLNNIDENKSDLFQRFKDVVISTSNKEEKENYVNNLKKKLQEELSKALIIRKETVHNK
jgi:hypothetical protein